VGVNGIFDTNVVIYLQKDCRPVGWGSWRKLSNCEMMLFVGLGRSQMGSWMDWWQQELEWLNAQARELEAKIAENVARILEV
jgi:hypothetical protein